MFIDKKWILKIRYLGATNTRGSRIKITDIEDSKNTITIPFDYKYNSALDNAVSYLIDNNIIATDDIIGVNQTNNDYWLILDKYIKLK